MWIHLITDLWNTCLFSCAWICIELGSGWGMTAGLVISRSARAAQTHQASCWTDLLLDRVIVDRKYSSSWGEVFHMLTALQSQALYLCLCLLNNTDSSETPWCSFFHLSPVILVYSALNLFSPSHLVHTRLYSYCFQLPLESGSESKPG